MIQIIQNWEKRKVIGSISIDELMDRVVNPEYNQKLLIETARKFERKSEEQNKIKEKLPCFTSAFSFKGYINKNNVSLPTGYLYLDVDNVDNIELDHPSVVFYCKSFSGKGYTVIVGVIGVTTKNIRELTIKIGAELNIKVDEAAISIDRLTIISYDINAYHNSEHTYFLFVENELKNPHYNSISYTYISNEYNGGKIRFDNFLEECSKIDFNGELLKDFGDNKLACFKIKFPFNTVTEGSRSTTLNYLCYYIKALNPLIDKNKMEAILNSVNINRFSPKLNEKDIVNTINSVFRIENFNVEPNIFRRFIYNPDYVLTTKEKRQNNIKIIHSDNSKKTLQIINSKIDNWDFLKNGKITQKTLALESGKNIKTIEKYYKEFKDKINSKNIAYKNNIL